MKYIFALLFTFCNCIGNKSFSQEVVYIKMSNEGNIMAFEIMSYNGQFDLSIDYYSCDAFTNVAKAGKLSKIGNIKFDYYPKDSFQDPIKAGKLSRIGNILIDYYPQDNFTDPSKWGKISKIKGSDQRIDLVIDYTQNNFRSTRRIRDERRIHEQN